MFPVVSCSEDSPVLRGLATEVVKVSEQGSIENVPATCTDSTEDAKCYEALQHIADTAAVILYRCFVLFDFLALQKKQNGISHEIWGQLSSEELNSTYQYSLLCSHFYIQFLLLLLLFLHLFVDT